MGGRSRAAEESRCSRSMSAINSMLGQFSSMRSQTMATRMRPAARVPGTGSAVLRLSMDAFHMWIEVYNRLAASAFQDGFEHCQVRGQRETAGHFPSSATQLGIMARIGQRANNCICQTVY